MAEGHEHEWIDQTALIDPVRHYRCKWCPATKADRHLHQWSPVQTKGTSNHLNLTCSVEGCPATSTQAISPPPADLTVAQLIQYLTDLGRPDALVIAEGCDCSNHVNGVSMLGNNVYLEVRL